ncbi:hypothetical protein GE061_014749 [Apolygus lucorum]|uniref:Uncharacterized protein n=1 Tax=Apolygus lucorum TaxID=248454 RepID=A0A6A4IWA4_APOLU|nr:hypothetical protein GE061_014749 [Apolygus lucorum]
MHSTVALLALVGCVAANPVLLQAVDDGQWRPELDGSVWGDGNIQWGLEDGSWKPHLDGSVLGDGHLTWLSRRRRSVALVNPNALATPLDEPITALAKNAQLIQQHTEGTRNILGGGIPLALPADTPEVAAGKQAHAIAHANQVAATSGHPALIAPAAIATPWAAPAAIATPWAAPAAIASPVIAARAVAAPWAVNSWAAGPLGIAGPVSAGHLTWLSRKRRSVALVNPNALATPLDEPITALAKNAQLIQQHTEGTRNILGGGIPLALPADTPEVAAGKQAHAIAHANQVAATSGHPALIAPAAIATPWAAPAAIATPWAARAIATPWAVNSWASNTWAAAPLGLTRTHWW